jgi:predicted metalloprotease with PDZ domain
VGDRVSVLVARRGELRRLDLTLGSEPPREWALELDPEASVGQEARRAAWLGQSR